MDKAKVLSEVLEYITITHHTSGRLRLDISSKIRELKDLESYNIDEVFNLKGINEVKVNKILGKVTILYDDKIISKQSLDNLINAKNIDEINLALKELNIA
ncbi:MULTISPECIES: HMA2 domain-containing protein [unclassified Campylobacter]|uniref:HMA2 domain-containing protein n=1 Tax=unclassified Campylobacter TaxID=2593542 RepID=UPI001BDAB131|nr:MULTISPECIES: hypothetical protein [unclassified Campylobacter]MBZ7980518.1 hypothetical protein [Campylobacter sp. RM12642]MBZ7980927.1 hypothetical protein [Campylobacter sp. RM12640]MBZ7983975.1 hypothetical protein [Campylobacter sp. RM12647]MBZ7988246.1 hypothetical protein [Campylobacter sp. RM12635]MBZ8006706.1 hypothetical protein [Campylobacter sp. RM9334]